MAKFDATVAWQLVIANCYQWPTYCTTYYVSHPLS